MKNLMPIQKISSSLVDQLTASQEFATTEAYSVFRTLLALYGTENLSRALRLYVESAPGLVLSEAARSELIVRIERWKPLKAA